MPLFSIAQFNESAPRDAKHYNFRTQVYTGGPTILKSAFKLSNRFQDAATYQGKPLIGAEFDYRPVSWFSVGADVSYRYGQVSFDVLDSTLFTEIKDKWGVQLSDYVDPFGHYELKIPRLRVMVKANFHVLPEESISDLYFTLGIGYNRVKSSLYLNDQEINYVNRIGTFSMPLAYRTSVGYGLHFTKNIGAFVEVGIGGPIISGGITARF